MPRKAFGKSNEGYRKYPVVDWIGQAEKYYNDFRKLSLSKQAKIGWPCLVLEQGTDFEIKPKSMAAYIERHRSGEPISVQFDDSSVRIYYYGQEVVKFRESA